MIYILKCLFFQDAIIESWQVEVYIGGYSRHEKRQRHPVAEGLWAPPKNIHLPKKSDKFLDLQNKMLGNNSNLLSNGGE